MLVLGYVWLPFVALPIFVTLESLDRRLLEAASDLYASRLQAFLRITLPLSLPGVVAAFLFVFIPTVGEFVTPSLVGGTSGYMYGNQIVDLFQTGFPDWETGAVLVALPARGHPGADSRLRALPPGGRGTHRLMDVALSRNGRRLMRVFFALVIVFLYAPIAILLVFSFNKAVVPSFPLSGFTLRWYHEFIHNGSMRSALEASAIVAALSSVVAVSLGILASVAIARRRFRGKGLVTALLLTPLVIPFVVLGIAMLLLFHVLGVSPSLLTVGAGHVVISLPYTILVLLPRLEQIDASLEEAAYDLGAGPFRTFRWVTFPLILPAIVSAFLIAFTTSFDEYAVASFLVGTRETFPIFLYGALRFPSQLPQVIAVAVVILCVSLLVIIGVEVWRRRAEARLEAA